MTFSDHPGVVTHASPKVEARCPNCGLARYVDADHPAFCGRHGGRYHTPMTIRPIGTTQVEAARAMRKKT
jgi:hypothetical protein